MSVKERDRQWMIEADVWAPKRQRRKRPFQLHERRSCIGELVQIDGSPHAWLEGRRPRCTLIAFIDDATGRLQYARFESAETSCRSGLGRRRIEDRR
ncbi:MAG: hypothetical protein HY847_19335 [Betaproteobacteria bacterium]|nr:hypothetical protein [Betaproteobacteria bacterium]